MHRKAAPPKQTRSMLCGAAPVRKQRRERSKSSPSQEYRVGVSAASSSTGMDGFTTPAPCMTWRRVEQAQAKRRELAITSELQASCNQHAISTGTPCRAHYPARAGCQCARWQQNKTMQLKKIIEVARTDVARSPRLSWNLPVRASRDNMFECAGKGRLGVGTRGGGRQRKESSMGSKPTRVGC